MSARGRAIGFFTLAAIAAVGGATVVGRYSQSAVERYGQLRPALVSTAALPAGQPLTPAAIGARVELRQVPESFRPIDAIARERDALGLEPAADLPAGTYLTRSTLRPPERPAAARRQRLTGDLRPVEIQVSGARSLTGAGVGHVDVVVTAEPDSSGTGRTYVAAARVPLLSLGPAPESAAPGISAALLGLTRKQALELIRAEAFARSIRLLPITGHGD